MKTPRSCRWPAVALTLLAGLLMTQPVPAAKKQVIKLTTLAPKGSSYHRSLQKMGQAWREASGGAVELIIYAGGTQGGESAMVERMWVGQSQAGMLTAAGLDEIEPAVAGLQNLPMMFESLEEVDYVGDRLKPRLEKRLLDKGFVVLFWADTGWVRFFSNQPVRGIDDLKKLKLFTWAGDAKTIKIMNGAGLNPVPLETADILTGLQTGLIDAVPMPPFFALASQIYRPAPHMLELNWAPLIGALVVTRKSWDRIPVDVRGRLEEAAAEAGREIKAAGRREAEASVRTMQEKWGLKVQKVDAALEAEWRAAARAAYPEIRGKIVPEEIFDEVKRLLREYRAKGNPS